MSIRAERILAEAVAWGLLLGLCAWALHAALAQAATQTWPFFHDAWRDVSVAQGILDGRYPEDPVILGATLWYNPLTGAMNALYAWMTGETAAQANVSSGPWINLLIPLGFFLFLRIGFGAWTAAAGALFLIAGNALHDRTGTWVTTTTYSPFLWAPHLGQALFFIALAFFAAELRHGRWSSRVGLGIAWGLTFMAHTSPAIVFGALYVLMQAWELFRTRPAGTNEWRTRLLHAVSPIAIAFVSSLPYTYSILWNYQFRMKNITPTRYVDRVAGLDQLPGLLAEAANWTTFVAVIGVVALWRMRKRVPAARLLLLWTALVLGFLAQFYLNLVLVARWGFGLPQLVPGHHHLINLGGVKAALFGAGLVALAGLAAKLFARGNAERIPATRSASAVLLLVVASIVLLPAYAKQLHFSTPMDFGWHTESFEDRRECVDWILANCPPDAVFLCDEQHSIRLVMPAARKAVQNIDIFSNPYVTYEDRVAAKFAMYDAFLRGDDAAFRQLAEEWHVTHLLVLEDRFNEDGTKENRLSFEQVEAAARPYTALAYHEDGIAIYRIAFGDGA
ncbi:MAG: hypothetical protein GC168_19335 [Candidatus Hydrogenedens sp.]|nr:hypothetical protein [Candidatus Hydrogenedens sp.]